MSRLAKADEIIELAIAMQNSYLGLTIDDIAEKFECSRRSAERMKALILEKFPDKIEEVEHTSDRKKRWRFKKGTMNFLINFTSNDFANLETCKELLTNSEQKKEIKELIAKIQALNPKNNYQNDVDAILESRGYAIRQQYREKINPEHLNIINESILCQKQIKFIYKNAENVVDPYGIIIGDKQYLLAYNSKYNDILIYRISKIEKLEILESYFEKDENFNIKDYSNSSFGIFQGKKYNVKLLFDQTAKDEVLEYYFHPTQEVNVLASGEVEITFTASGLFEIITELLKWRNSVKILAPKELKNEYNKTVEDMFRSLG